MTTDDGGRTDNSTGTEEQAADVGEAIRIDLERCRSYRLASLVTGVLVVVLGATALAIAGFSVAFPAQTTLTGFVETITTNAAWFYFSLFALVGLFLAFPAHERTDNGRRTISNSRTEFVGTLLSRWVLLSVAVVVASLIPLAIGIATFDEFGIGAFLGFVVVTALTLCGYTAIGLSFAAVTRTDTRLVFWLLAFYWLLAFIWETSLLPLVVAIAVTGDPEGTIGDPPTIHDALLAASPGGAHASISDALVGAGFGTVEGVAVLSLLAWLVVPPVLASWRTDI